METGPSKREHAHDAWDPDWIRGRFCLLMQCDYEGCGEIAAVSGTSSIDEFYDQDEYGNPTREYGDRFRVSSISPAPFPIKVPPPTPEAVKASLIEASALIWQSADSAGNKIRSSVELLMDDQRISKTSLRNGKRVRMSLHARIEKFKQANRETGEALLAIKWLGNSGSHIGPELKRSDVLDAFDIIEFALDDVYAKSRTEIMKKVRLINKNKGPAKPKKRRSRIGGASSISW